MKIRMIVDPNGIIIGTMPAELLKAEGDGAPSGGTVIPLPGQAIQEVDIPDEIARPPLHDLSQRFRVKDGKLFDISIDQYSDE